MDTPLATLRPSAPRLWFAVICLAAFAGTLLWIAVAQPPDSLGWRGFLLLSAILVGWSGLRLLHLRDRALVLTEDALVDTKGGVVCRIADIERLNTSTFALKPARGFAIDLVQSGERAWIPGLWWRIGRNVGVGGMTAALDTRMMAERLEALVAARKAAATRSPSTPGSAARSAGSSPPSRSASSRQDRH
jgi:hypothetical protein